MAAAAMAPALLCQNSLQTIAKQVEVCSTNGNGSARIPMGKTTPTAGAASMDEFEQRALSLLGNLKRQQPEDSSRSAPGSANPQDGELSSAFTGALLELVQVAAQLSQIDVVAGKATESSPQESDEARHWRDLSMCALEWSRGTLAQRQAGMAERLERTMQVTAGPLPSSDTMPSAISIPDQKANCAAEGSLALAAPPGLAPPPGLAAPPPGFGTFPPSLAVDDVVDDNTAGEGAADNARQRGLEEFEKGGTLRTHLEQMNGEDQRCILVVRRINRLGFQSPSLLEEYFQRFGGAKHVFVAHSRVKPSTKRPAYRIRPAGLGFVVMGSFEAAEEVMEVTSHEIHGCVIEMSFYKDRAGDLNFSCVDEDRDIVTEDTISA